MIIDIKVDKEDPHSRPESLDIDFNDKQIERLDEMYNSVYNTICVLLNKEPEDVPWDIRPIAECTDAMIHILLHQKITDNIYYPTRIIDVDKEYIEDYVTIEDFEEEDD